MIEPIRKQITVAASREQAFRVFTAELGQWWPVATHHIGGKPAETAIIEPHVGGRWFERAADGSECLWGHVRVWDPPARLILSWEINGDWQHDDDFSTEVELRFVLVSPLQTRIEFEHRQLERFGDKAVAARGAMDDGWGTVLALYAARAGKTT